LKSNFCEELVAPLEKYNALPPRHRRRLLVLLLPLLVGKLFHETKSLDLATKKRRSCVQWNKEFNFPPLNIDTTGGFEPQHCLFKF
jgi:hypothetical protein